MRLTLLLHKRMLVVLEAFGFTDQSIMRVCAYMGKTSVSYRPIEMVGAQTSSCYVCVCNKQISYLLCSEIVREMFGYHIIKNLEKLFAELLSIHKMFEEVFPTSL